MDKKVIVSDNDLHELVNMYQKFSKKLPCLNTLKDDLSRKYKLTDNQILFLDSNNLIDWCIYCCSRKDFSISFLEKFDNKVDWEVIIRKMQLPLNILKLKYTTYYNDILTHQKNLNEEFLDQIFELKNFTYLPRDFCKNNRNLSENFLSKYPRVFESKYVVMYQNLSEDFLEKYICKDTFVEWNLIIEHQYNNISFDFINKYKHKFRWDSLLQQRCMIRQVPDEFYCKFINNFSINILRDIVSDKYEYCNFSRKLKTLFKQTVLINNLEP